VFYVVVFHALANLPFDIALNREVTARFWQQPNLFLCAWIGLGVAGLMRWIHSKSDSAAVQYVAATRRLIGPSPPARSSPAP
jgi:hypothetical protein